MSTLTASPECHATIRLFGDVFALDYPAWILRHANKLGVGCVFEPPLEDCMHLAVTGPEEMLEALALGCSLGPASVMVERVEYTITDPGS